MKKATPDQILKALAKVPPIKREMLRERNKAVKSGKEIEIRQFLKEIKIQEINEWVKKNNSSNW